MAGKKLLFDNKVLGEICARHINKPTREMIEGLEADLRDYYGPIISTDQPWISAPAGGLFYHLKFFTVAPGEYLFMGGLPFPCTGTTGRNPVDYHDFILKGHSVTVPTDGFETKDVNAGDCLYTAKWESFNTHIDKEIWFLEHCTGSLWAIMPFGLANHIFVTLDFLTLFRMIKCHAVLTWRYYMGGKKSAQQWLANKEIAEVAADKSDNS